MQVGGSHINLSALLGKSNFQILCTIDGASDQPTLTFRFSYLPLWQDIMGIVSRDGRGAAICSDHLLSELLTALVALLHGARQYIRTDGEIEHLSFVTQNCLG